jgi:probable rRNA maturation factor
MAKRRATQTGERPRPAAMACATLTVDILVESPKWKASRGHAQLFRRALTAAARIVPAWAAEVAIVLTDDKAMRELNLRWRKKDASTNVLSFATMQAPEPNAGTKAHAADPAPGSMGDIVLAYETMAREAEAEHKPLRDHAAHLVVHGYLHLSGYDHETDAEAVIMEELEIAILDSLRVPNPYVARRRRR